MTKATTSATGSRRGTTASAKVGTVATAKKRSAAKPAASPPKPPRAARKRSDMAATGKAVDTRKVVAKSAARADAGTAARKRAPGPGLIATVAGISSAAVTKATGHGWDFWLKALDRLGAAKLTHPEIARMLYDKLGLRKNWWCK